MSDITVAILKDLRADIRATNDRLDLLGRDFRTMLGLLGLISDRLFSGGGLDERVERCEREIDEIKRRLDDDEED